MGLMAKMHHRIEPRAVMVLVAGAIVAILLVAMMINPAPPRSSSFLIVYRRRRLDAAAWLLGIALLVWSIKKTGRSAMSVVRRAWVAALCTVMLIWALYLSAVFIAWIQHRIYGQPPEDGDIVLRAGAAIFLLAGLSTPLWFAGYWIAFKQRRTSGGGVRGASLQRRHFGGSCAFPFCSSRIGCGSIPI